MIPFSLILFEKSSATERRASTPSTTTRSTVTEQTFHQWLSDVIDDDVIKEQSAEAVSADLADWTNDISDVSIEELRMTGEVIDEISHLEEVSTEVRYTRCIDNHVDVVQTIISYGHHKYFAKADTFIS